MSKAPVIEFNEPKKKQISASVAAMVLQLNSETKISDKELKARLNAMQQLGYELYEYNIFCKPSVFYSLKPIELCVAADVLVLDAIAQDYRINNIELNQKLFKIYEAVYEEKDFNIFIDSIPRKLGCTTNWYIFDEVYYKYCIYGAEGIWRPYNLFKSEYEVWKEKMGYV